MEPVADRYRRLSEAVTATIAGVGDDGWSNQSPCQDWTARDVAAHLVDVHGLFQSLVGREAAEHPSVDDDPLGAFIAVRDQMQTDLEDPAKVDEEYEGQFGRSTFGAAVNGFVCFDLVVHRWDLAKATGQDEAMEPQDVELIQAMVDKMGQTMRDNGVLGPAVQPPEGASAQDKLVSDLGRRA